MDSSLSVVVPENKECAYLPRSATISWDLFVERRALFQERFCALSEQRQIALEQFKSWRCLPLPRETRRILLISFQQQCLQIQCNIQQIQSDLRHEQLALGLVRQELGWQRQDLERMRASQMQRMAMRWQ